MQAIKAVLVAWLLSAMTFWVPVATKSSQLETEEARHTRWESIAADIYEVAYDPAEAPLFPEPDARSKTAALIGAIASYESKFDLDIDTGKRVGDLGEVCIMQVLVDRDWHAVNGPKTREGWTKKEVIADRKKCIRSALHILRTSAEICGNGRNPQNRTHKSLTGSDLYTIYTSGKCSEGGQAAHERYDRAVTWSAAHPVPSVSPSASASAAKGVR